MWKVQENTGDLNLAKVHVFGTKSAFLRDERGELDFAAYHFTGWKGMIINTERRSGPRSV
jgi:hypothetical protein